MDELLGLILLGFSPATRTSGFRLASLSNYQGHLESGTQAYELCMRALIGGFLLPAGFADQRISERSA